MKCDWREDESMNNIKFSVGMALLLLLTAAADSAGAECITCKGGSASTQQDVLNAEWASFMNGESTNTTEIVYSTGGLVNPKYNRANNAALESAARASADETATEGTAEKTDAKEVGQSASDADFRAPSNSGGQGERSAEFAAVLAPLTAVNDSEIILDISPDASEYIPGAVSIPYTEFLETGGALKSVSEMAGVLGNAGISADDSVLIYGECQPCGGGPSAATYVYWIMKYLGHEKVRLMDGGMDDWVAAQQPTAWQPANLTAQTYTPSINASLLASFEFVRSGTAQIIDARSQAEFEAGSIPESINIPYDRVLDGKSIKDEESLKEIFSSLEKARPVVVYTNTGVKASMTWLALALLGYDARIYSWQEWQSSLPHLNLTLQEARANPNPAEIGDAVTITAVFAAKNQSKGSEAEGSSGNMTILTIKGCATCGFGSPQGYADLSSSDGVVRIGSASQTERTGNDNGFTVSARVSGPSGKAISKVIMKRIKSGGDEFSGIWNANVAAGDYTVDIEATAGQITESFQDALQIRVGSRD